MTKTDILPINWQRTTLGKIRRQEKAGVDPRQFPEEKFELYSVPSFENKIPEIIFGKEIGSSKQVVKPDVVLLCKINPRINRVWIVGDFSDSRKIASTEWIPFYPQPQILKKYLAYYLTTGRFRDFLAQNVSGVGGSLMRTKASVFADYPFPLPPIKEQERIVAKIEELLSELDAGVESLKKAQTQLKTYRQAVLKSAFEGNLTNENVPKGELPIGWSMTTLGNVVKEPTYGTSKKCSYEFDGKGVLRIPNIVKGVIDPSDLKGASFTTDEIETYELRSGDLLTIRSNGSVNIVGKCAIVTERDEDFLFAGYLIRLRPIEEKMLSKYLLYVFGSHELRVQIERKAKSTSGVNNINAKELKSLEFPICSPGEQHQVVAEIENRLSVCDKLEETIAVSLKQSEALRQSILRKAFYGNLVEQDANDEPAAILLESSGREREEVMATENLKKKDRPRVSKSKRMAENSKSILQLLEENGEPIATYTLWQSSEYKNDIDKFYAEVKELLENGIVAETAREGKESFLVLTANR